MNPKLMVIDGKTCHSVEDVPACVREKSEQEMLGSCALSGAGVWYFFLRLHSPMRVIIGGIKAGCNTPTCNPHTD